MCVSLSAAAWPLLFGWCPFLMASAKRRLEKRAHWEVVCVCVCGEEGKQKKKLQIHTGIYLSLLGNRIVDDGPRQRPHGTGATSKNQVENTSNRRSRDVSRAQRGPSRHWYESAVREQENNKKDQH